MSVFAVVSQPQEVSKHDPHDAIIQHPPGPHDGGIQDAHVPPASSRQSVIAHVLPMSMLFYADASFVTQDMTDHPIYCKRPFAVIHILRIVLIFLLLFLCSMSFTVEVELWMAARTWMLMFGL